MNLRDKDDKSITQHRCEHPIFDREMPSEFKYFQENVFAALEIEDIEECATDVWE